MPSLHETHFVGTACLPSVSQIVKVHQYVLSFGSMDTAIGLDIL
jgi:hypothetical protein